MIALKSSSRNLEKFKIVLETNESRTPPKWLDLNREAVQGTVTALPERDDIDFPIEEHLIVELYSK